MSRCYYGSYSDKQETNRLLTMYEGCIDITITIIIEDWDNCPIY